ncbi:MAG: hypothetical protein NTV46_11670 [Verrucomicrobia bacterium]|nr:hypothetical protein [Verrucomicrobiota bacterium]
MSAFPGVRGFAHRCFRTGRDHGLVCILDNRVLTKRCGQAFLNALPDAPVEVIG